MSAAMELSLPELVELRRVRADDFRALLEVEIREWRNQMDWDFRSSAELVGRFVSAQALGGFALVQGRTVAGYSYFVCEERKGLIGDLYVAPEWRTVENENRLLAAVAGQLIRTPGISRIESQLMMLQPARSRPLPGNEFLRAYWRNFMAIDSARARELLPGRAREKVLVEPWRDAWQDAAAHLIEEAYQGHIDASINDQYRSAAGARRFLANIVQHPGCGEFFQPASYLAFDPATGRLCGMSLASLLAEDSGHITQVSVSPRLRGTGVGYELLRRSLLSLAETGCRKTSLTVTAANLEAVRLYERMGFTTARKFAALVWDGF